MVFKFHNFELLPWGATLKITCTSSSRNIKSITKWKNSTNYSTTYGDLGKNRSFFIESKKQPISMTYTCNSTNGHLVSVSTNLQYSIDEIYKYDNKYYIKKFTISNENWFNTPYEIEEVNLSKTNNPWETIYTGTISYTNRNKLIEDCMDEQGRFIPYTKEKRVISIKGEHNIKKVIVRFQKEKPYIKLCCNKVKIESRFVEVDKSNNFSLFDYDQNYLYPATPLYQNTKAKLLRYITISWNLKELNQLYYGETNSGGGFGSNKYYFYKFCNGKVKLIKYIEAHGIKEFSYIIPMISKYKTPYFSIGYTVNFDGEDKYWCNSSQYIQGNYTDYTEDGFIKNIKAERTYLDIEYKTGVPELNSLEYWDGNQFYKSTEYVMLCDDYESHYLSPSDGYTIETDWYVQCVCDDCDSCDFGDEEEEICQCDHNDCNYDICNCDNCDEADKCECDSIDCIYDNCNCDVCDNSDEDDCPPDGSGGDGSCGGSSQTIIHVKKGLYDECRHTGQAFNDGWEHMPGDGVMENIPEGDYPLQIITDQGWIIFIYNKRYWN